MLTLPSIEQRIAQELGAREAQIVAAIGLLDEGATVPFISRYRKEATGGLDDTQMRNLEERLGYLRELEERRVSVIGAIEEQGKMTDALKQSLLLADSKTRLEDLYLPYKQKRRTKAQIAIEAGLEPLADGLWKNPALDPRTEATKFVHADQGVADADAALEGARQILMERFAEDAELVGQLRSYFWARGQLHATVVAGKEIDGAKFSDYFDKREAIKAVPSHRALAMFRGRAEDILNIDLELPEDAEA